MIEQFYLTNRWNPNSPGQSTPENNDKKGVLHIPQTLRLVSHHQMQFNVILRILNGFKYYY